MSFDLLETMLFEYKRKEIFLLDRHLRRLSASAAYFNFRCSIDDIRTRLLSIASGQKDEDANFFEKNGEADCIARLTVSQLGDATVELRRLRPIQDPCHISLSLEPVSSANLDLRHKTTNRNLYTHLLSQVQEKFNNIWDVILYNEREFRMLNSPLVVDILGNWNPSNLVRSQP